MRPGGGKQKGAQYERDVCKRLSLWVSDGKDEDLFWRSAMSGGRATVAKRKGVDLRKQAGDITATSAEGCHLTDRFFIECKFVKSLGLEGFLFSGVGLISGYWSEACAQAALHKKWPLLIAKQNRMDSIVIINENRLKALCVAQPTPILTCAEMGFISVVWFDEVLASRYWAT